MILFTSDIDWAPDDVIIDMLSIFKKYNVKCTLFCTHDSDILEGNMIKIYLNWEYIPTL